MSPLIGYGDFGTTLDILPERGRDLILAGAIFSIMLNPLLFVFIDKFVLSEPIRRARRRSPRATHRAYPC